MVTGRDLEGRTDLPQEDGLPPLLLKTSQPGVFASEASDPGSVKCVASAVGEVSMAVRLVHRRLAARWAWRLDLAADLLVRRI